MARDPGRIIGYVEDDVSKVKTEVRLLTNRMEFYARVGTLTTRDKDGDVVRAWIKQQHKAMRVTTWSPIIVVEYSSTDRPEKPHFNGRRIKESQVGELHLTIRRSYAGVIGAGVRELDWQDFERLSDPMARVNGSYSLPYDVEVLDNLPWRQQRSRWDSGVEIVLRYDEQTWGGLVAIVAGVERARRALKSILRDPSDAATFLQAVGSGASPVAALMSGPPIEDGSDRDDEEDEEDDDS